MNHLFILAVLAMLLSSARFGGQSPLFTPAPGSPVAVGEGSGRLVFADVNRDGKLDLLSQHLLQHVVTVQLGDGTGRFAPTPGSPIKLSYSPGDIKVGDVNGDGMPDLFVTNTERDIVDVFPGGSDGKFSPASGFVLQANAPPRLNSTWLHLLDINEDGKSDIIAISNQQNSFATLLGNGRGGFAPGPVVTFPAGQGRYAFAFGDLDGDMHLDVAIANSGDGEGIDPGRVIVMQGNGKGAFRKLAEMSVLAGPRWITLGDLNGDGRPDLAMSHNSHQLSIMLNQGGGKFLPGPDCDFNAEVFGVTVADVNGDKQNDLIAATVDSVTVLLNGKNKFAPATGSPFRAGPGAYHLAVGDVNRDNKPDIAASSFEGKAVTILLGR
jgi:hypothetical protein